MLTRNKNTNYLKLDSVYRIGSIPLVETGIGIGGKVYHSIKESNPVFRWSLSQAERSLALSLELAAPAVPLLAAPLGVLDRAICRSLDAVEARVPALHLPPQMMYARSAEYVNSRLVPALRRASSVQHLSVAALATADRVVDRILPPDAEDTTDAGATEQAPAEEGARLRRKLRRRLTRQAFAEAKAIKEQIHVLVYVAELVATNPRAAWHKARSLYTSLSGPEPENQARPATLEELLVLVTREAARRVVHLVNYTSDDLPRNVKSGVRLATNHFAQAAETLAKTIHLEGIKKSAYRELSAMRIRFQELLDEMKKNSKTLLEQLALFLAGEEREKLPRARRHNIVITDHDNSVNGLN